MSPTRPFAATAIVAAALAGAAALTGAAAAPAALPAGCVMSGSAVTCTYISGTNAFAVPAGVRTISVLAIGGSGGGAGGLGAAVSGNLGVTPGATLYAAVGANGTVANPGGPATAGGGGSGGVPSFCISDPQLCQQFPPGPAGDTGGNGGGASDIRISATDLSSRLLVAGGGGGAGSAAPGTTIPGGAGGGAAGAGGGTSSSLAGGGGGGGTAATGGSGGAISSAFCVSRCQPGGPGNPGTVGNGGGGGAGGTELAASILIGGPGGGGGGGLFGGGGGAGGSGNGPGGGGGGGSNLVPAGGGQSLDTTRRGPLVQITYSPVAQPTITGVRFRGDPRDPTIVIRGSGFGPRPPADPRRGTSYLGHCGRIPGRTGKDYGTALWIRDRTQGWSAGNTALGDCVGLVLLRYSDREIRFRLGSFYRLAYGRPTPSGSGVYVLAPHDLAVIVVHGARLRTLVRYG